MRRLAIAGAVALVVAVLVYGAIERRPTEPSPPPAPAGPAQAPAGENTFEAASVAALDDTLNAAGFSLAKVRAGTQPVPRLYVAAMPRDMAAIAQGPEKKRIFIKLMLPLILAANERILADRARLLGLAETVRAGAQPAADDAAWLSELAARHYVEEDDLEALIETAIERVDAIPTSLALAQAALESGWGTSRFVHEGNAAFGQRSWNQAEGMTPAERQADQDHVVKSFSNLKQSVFAYLVNLNRHPAYERLRRLRAVLRTQGHLPDGWTLAEGLDGYAEEPDYVARVRALIRQNALADFDRARLTDLAG